MRKWLAVCAIFWSAVSLAGAITLNESKAVEGEWGYHPAHGSVQQVTPPGFTWRPSGKMTYEIEVFRGEKPEGTPVYSAKGIVYNVHCPPETFVPGAYTWRYRGTDEAGRSTNWSAHRTFRVADGAKKMPMPKREELLARIPKSHPRLFVRPEDLPKLREMAGGQLKDRYESLVTECEKILAAPPSTEEPPVYPPGTKSHDETWRKIWWGNRVKVTKALNGAATLGFTYRLSGDERYGREARRILMECAKWDPKGATGYRYNDEAGMPYAYYFSRAYTFVNDLLTDAEKAECRQMMRIRGLEMYNHLYPRHLWKPYASHSNRAWHFLGEIGIAFHDEIPEADEWVWFAMNVFFNCYPVWSDADGGWHEGSSYWSSYQGRFTWWADVMREALGINAYDKPYYSSIGYYAMYLMPPNKVGGGFGDLTAKRRANQYVGLITTFATQARNAYWEWWVEANGGPKPTGGYIGFIRGAIPPVEAKEPTALPTSRVFKGIGQAYLNTNLMDARDDVQITFKSSPFGTQSHGYEANNSFLLWAYGQRLLIRSGYRDIYGSAHHKNWMWSTRSVNNITVGGYGQMAHTARAKGEILAFGTSPSMDYVVGEAGPAYGIPVRKDDRGRIVEWRNHVNRFTRSILFIKPDLMVVYDRLDAREPSGFTYWLHALEKIKGTDQRALEVRKGDVVCDVDFLAPQGLTLKQTDQYDPNPRPRIKLREWHLSADTSGKSKTTEFVVLYRPRKAATPAVKDAQLQTLQGGYLLTAKLADGTFTAILPSDDSAAPKAGGLETRDGKIVMRLERRGKPAETMTVE